MAQYKRKLYGAILGDLAGQPYEKVIAPNMDGFNLHNPASQITDDTIMTLATAAAVMAEEITTDGFMAYYRHFYNMYPGEQYGYGKMFMKWADNKNAGKLGKSYGNGCLMRLAPIFYQNQRHVENELDAMISCFTSHVDPEAALAVGKYGFYWGKIKGGIWAMKPEAVKPFEKFSCTAEDTIAFIAKELNTLGKTQDTIKRAVTYGGDTDTHACILGEFANYRKRDISDEDAAYVESKLDDYLRQVLINFNEQFPD